MIAIALLDGTNAFHWKSVDTGTEPNTAKLYADVLEAVIKDVELRDAKVIGIVGDNHGKRCNSLFTFTLKPKVDIFMKNKDFRKRFRETQRYEI